jgi:DNA-binding NtrC family response regulator
MTAPAIQTILCVDDDPWILATAKKILEVGGYRVLTTTDPLQVLPLIEWEEVDMVVADLAMPEVDGVHLLQRVRELYPDVPRILLSGTASLESALRAINESEVFRFLTKPIEQETLLRTVGEAALRRQAMRQTAARERAAARRESALGKLEEQHPGLGSAQLEDGVHVISSDRIRQLHARLGGSVLGSWLEADPAADAAADAGRTTPV